MPAPYSAGSIFLQVVPSFRGVPEQIAREARENWADAASDGFDERMEKRAQETGKKMGAQISKELGKAGKDAGDKAGQSYSGAFRSAMTKGIAAAQRELNTTPLKLVLHDEDLRKKIDKIRADFKSLDRQVKLGTDAGGAFIEMQRLLGVIENVQDKAKNIEVRSNLAGIHRELTGVAAHIQQLSAMGIEPELKIDRQLGLFERRLKAGIQSALNDLPPVTLDDTEANAQVRALREKLLGLDTQVDVGVDSAQAFTALAAIEAEAERIADTAMTMDLRVNAAGVFKTTAAVRAELESLSRITIEPEVDLDRNLGAFERGLKGAIDGALRDLGAIRQAPAGDPRLGENVGQRAVRDLREQLMSLGDMRIGIDISAETARERIAQIRDALEQLRREHWSVDLDADTAAAHAHLDGFVAALEAIDHETYTAELEIKGVASAIAQARAADAALGHTSDTIKRLSSNSNDGANSFRAFNIRVLGVAALGPLVVPALGAIAAGIGALLPLVAAGAAGLGVLGFALMGVKDAFKAMGDAQAHAGQDAKDHEKSVRSAATGVADAERSVADARRNAGEAAEQAARQVTQAERGVKQAEQGLADAQKTAQQAQEDLTQARVDAAEQMEDLRLAVEGGALAERDAVLDLKDAQKDLATARADGVDGDELERYILKVDQADLALRRTRESNGDLAEESEKWAKTGVEGSDKVVAAQERVAAAQDGIAKAQDALTQAEDGFAQARQAQAQQAADSQRAITDAQRDLAEAQLAYSDALADTSSSQDKLRQSMEKLGPAGQNFVRFLDGLRPKFDGLRAIAQEGILPGLTDWIDSMVNVQGPRLTAVVGNISGAIGGMFTQFGQSIRGPAFSGLFDMLATSGPIFIRQMGDVLTNLGEGVARLIVAMEPLGHLFGQWLVDAAKRFNEWATNLSGTSGLRDFFDWAERVVPKVANFIWKLGDALVQIGIAIAPFAEGMVDKLTGFFDWISEMNPAVLGPIVISIAALTVALQAIFGLTALAHQFKSAINLTRLSLENLGGATKFLGWAGILATAFFVLYQNSEDFRNGVNHLWKDVIEPFGSYLNDSFGPVFEWIGTMLSDNIELIAGIAAAWASWKIITQVAAWVEALRVAMAGLAVAQAAVAGTAAAGGIMTGITSAAGMGLARGGLMAGGGLAATGVGLLLAGGMYAANRSSAKDEKGWMQAVRGGGSRADAAREEMANPGLWDRFKFNLGHWGNTEKVGERQTREVNAALGAEWDAMTPLAQAQQKVAEWTKTLSDRQKSGTATADELTAAQQRLEHWTGMLDKAQGTNVSTVDRLNEASNRLLQTRNAEANQLIAVTDAEIAYTQSQAALTDAHDEYVRVMKDGNATEEERRRAEEAWVNQSRQTADAAKAVATARTQGADAAVQEAHGNAALLLDLERQKETYGSLPPALEELRAGLAATVDPAVLAAEKFADLGLKVDEVPNGKTIVISSTTPEQIAALEALGYKVEELPDGEYKVTAKTDEAQLAIDELVKSRTIEITAKIQPLTSARQNQTGAWAPIPGSAGRNAQGGHITGPGTGTSDSILSWLSNGEYVVKAASVAKYGVGLLDAINKGDFSGDAPAYRTGGPVRQKFKRGRPAFEDGGYIANYGGSISLSGMAVPELAQWWVGALGSINSAASQAATHISTAFSQLRTALLGNFRDTHTESSSIWTELFDDITGKATTGAGVLAGIFGGIRDDSNTKTTETHTGVTGAWQTLKDAVLGRAGETRDQSNTIFGQMRDNLGTRAWEAVTTTKGWFDNLPGWLTSPINTILDKVLNSGLFKAFNSVVSTLGLDEKFKIADPGQVKLATGGRVPGSSPHSKADNIPAMLTAGEWVQPVDSVNYYGHDFMEALRKRQIPREALGISPIHRANGGLVELGRRLQAMGAKVTEHPAFGGVAMGGHGKTSLHYTGHAIDVNTRPGTSALEQAELAPMERLARSLGFRTIFMAPDHFNHLHVDDGGGQSILGKLGGLLSGALGALTDPIGALKSAVELGLAGLETSPVTRMIGAGARKLVDLMGEKVTGWIGDFFNDGDEGVKGKLLSGNAAANEQIVQSLAAARGWTGSEWSALRGLVMKESGFNNLAQNPTSSAYGMFQFLNGTWGPYGSKTSDPTKQAQYGLSYIAGRYGSPSKALAFHNKNNWYSEGGPVQDVDSATGAIIPDLHDMGGMVMPGLNVLMNRTGKPEAVINPQTLDALLAVAERGDDGGDHWHWEPRVIQGPTAEDMAREMMHHVTVVQRGGKRR